MDTQTTINEFNIQRKYATRWSPIAPKLEYLHPDLRPYIEEIMELIDFHRLPFRIFETGRPIERQKKLVEAGASKTLNSKHILICNETEILQYAKAVDFVLYYKEKDSTDFTWSWVNRGDDAQKARDMAFYKCLAELINAHFKDRVVDVTIGGWWSTFKDWPHYSFDLGN